MNQNATLLTPSPAVLLDQAAIAIGGRMKDATYGLPWITEFYGAIERRVKEREGVPYYYPAALADSTGLEYIDMMPDALLGNYAYLDGTENQEVEFMRSGSRVKYKVAIVFWFDLRDIYTGDAWKTKTLENVKQTALAWFETASFPEKISLQIAGIKTKAEDIYRGYSVNEIGQQYLMRPYGGFRFDA
ncbi:MAG: hypothetical protein KDD04_09520, partial [Sinomicrobium sp.]|nr:hypothetical protein [Sinomicrobium sp.]